QTPRLLSCRSAYRRLYLDMVARASANAIWYAATPYNSPHQSRTATMKRKLTIVALCLNFIGPPEAPFAADSDAPASPEVTAALQPYFDQYKLAGAIGIVADKSGKVHYKNLLGYADVEAKQPISEGNIFWIASMSKMFAGASIMMLADEGKVSL